jgi:hypothetical protein
MGFNSLAEKGGKSKEADLMETHLFTILGFRLN